MESFGTTPDGHEVRLLRLGAAPGVELELLTLGATVHRLRLTGGDGERRDVVLGGTSVAERLAATSYLGATVGRYANRIAGGRFELDGREVVLEVNDRGNTLHGGPDGFDRRVWDVVEHDDTTAVLRLVSPDGDQGFPGELVAEVRFEVGADELRITHSATTDAPTVVCLTNHSYLNLDGDGTVEDHLLEVEAAAFLPVDDTGAPPGGPAPVAGTPFDLRTAARIGDAVRGDHPEVVRDGGIDHDLLPDGEGFRRVAVLTSPRTRTRAELWADQPGLQVYTGNTLDPQHAGVALEPQVHPDSPHHLGEPGWTSPVLRPGERYESRLAWRFGPVEVP